MKIILVMSETSLWKPSFVLNLIEKLSPKHKIVATVLTNFRPRGVSKLEHIRRYYIMLGCKPFFVMMCREIYHSVAERIDRMSALQKPHSIAGVCRKYNIPTFITDNVNDEKTVSWIKKFDPDVILSSGNQIFKEELISVPRKACINRHTSLLPAYAGIYPIFWCLLNNEQEVGVSVHTMEKEIDKGMIISQESIRVKPHDTFFSLFEKCFELSVYAVLNAIEKIALDDWQPIASIHEPSYYSYPTWKDVCEFRRKGKKML